MASAKPSTKSRSKNERHTKNRVFCATPPEIKRDIDPQASPPRLRAINEYGKIWANGTQLRYYFFNRSSDGETIFLNDGSTKFLPW